MLYGKHLQIGGQLFGWSVSRSVIWLVGQSVNQLVSQLKFENGSKK